MQQGIKRVSITLVLSLHVYWQSLLPPSHAFAGLSVVCQMYGGNNLQQVDSGAALSQACFRIVYWV